MEEACVGRETVLATPVGENGEVEWTHGAWSLDLSKICSREGRDHAGIWWACNVDEGAGNTCSNIILGQVNTHSGILFEGTPLSINVSWAPWSTDLIISQHAHFYAANFGKRGWLIFVQIWQIPGGCTAQFTMGAIPFSVTHTESRWDSPALLPGIHTYRLLNVMSVFHCLSVYVEYAHLH